MRMCKECVPGALSLPPSAVPGNEASTIWLVIFVGTNFHKTGQNLGFRNFRGFNFHGHAVNLGPVQASTTAKSRVNV